MHSINQTDTKLFTLVLWFHRNIVFEESQSDFCGCEDDNGNILRCFNEKDLMLPINLLNFFGL